MSNHSYRSSRPDRWTDPRPHCDASQRLQTHGPLQPMEDDSPRFSWVQAIVIAVGFWGALFLFALVTP